VTDPAPRYQRTLLQALAIASSTDKQGEAVNAILAALRLIKTAGVDLQTALTETLQVKASQVAAEIDLERLTKLNAAAYERGKLAGIEEGRKQAATSTASTVVPGSYRAFAETLMNHYTYQLTAWERDFLDAFLGAGWSTPTAKQHAVMQRISNKTGVKLPGASP
jgi:hypothetical protein